VAWPVQAADATGQDRAHDLFTVVGGNLLARRSIMPIMLTTNAQVACGDCLFYVVHPR